jgi:GTP-binding protein EngB required for normal cell division
MKTHDIIEFLSAEEMHEASLGWLRELEFIKDEHLFFEDMITSFSLQLIQNKGFEQNVEIIDIINASQKRNNSLIKIIKKHDKNLRLLVDGIDQIKEETVYKQEHRNLIEVINEHLKEYKSLKTQLFAIIKGVIKKEKQKKLMA